MIADPRARGFTTAFLGQWLGFQSLGTDLIPDKNIFPEFDDALSTAMKEETILTFEHLLKNEYSLLNLLNTSATFINQPLAELYGIPDVEGNEMRPIMLADSSRGGLLGMASILTATSSPTRTSPVLRGKWVLETLLGEHIPEPPADAGQLDADAGQNEGLSLRDELMMHRNNPDCRSCHERIDPIGFGMENFDGIGRFRTEEHGRPIDSSGQLGSFKFSGTSELKTWILRERRDPFIRNISERMLTFALGRKLETFDEGPILEILENLSNDNYKATTLIKEIVVSYPFLHQNNSPETHSE